MAALAFGAWTRPQAQEATTVPPGPGMLIAEAELSEPRLELMLCKDPREIVGRRVWSHRRRMAS